eukprot:18966-Heterococcus_DN1.PRE.3
MINRVLSTGLGCQLVIVVDAVEVSNYGCYWHVGTAPPKVTLCSVEAVQMKRIMPYMPYIEQR